MITSVRLQNFKAHRDTTVELGRFTVLVGPNGSGKTSVLQALWLLGQVAKTKSWHVLRGDFAPADLVNRTAEGPICVEVHGDQPPQAWSVRLDVGRPIEDDERSQHVEMSWAQGALVEREEVPKKPNGHPKVAPPLQNMRSTRLFHFDAQKISAAAYSGLKQPRVGEDGTNTAVVLAALKLEQDDVFDQIQKALRQVVPSVERIRVRRAAVEWEHEEGTPPEMVMGHKVYIDFHGASGVPAHAASEGTLVTLALLTVLHSPTRPKLLLLDDIDQSLHPRAQIELIRQIKRLLDEMPDLQIVATTHSPYVLDELDPKDVHVFALKNDGSVAHKRLSEHAEAAAGVLTSGQIWSLDPEEEWVAKESP